MNEQRRQMNQRILDLRGDYTRARARINWLLANDDKGEEFEQLEQFVGYIDTLVECFPENQRMIIRLCILDDIPLSKAAIDIGYHYTWVLALRDKTVLALEEVLAGDKIIRSKLGLQVKEKLDAVHTSNPTDIST